MIDKKIVEEMSDGKDKKLMEILLESGKPYVKKHDGYAVKMTEDKLITYTDYNNTELTLKIPADSYVMVGEDSSCPKIVTEKEFNDSNKFTGEEASVSSDEKEEAGESEKGEEKETKPAKAKIGMALID